MQALAACRAFCPGKRQSEAGAVLVFAMGMVMVVIFIGAMVIDTMRIEMTRRTLRRTADAAALAAAMELRPGGIAMDNEVGWVRAKRAALAVLRTNSIAGIDLGTPDFSRDCTPMGPSINLDDVHQSDILCTGPKSNWAPETKVPDNGAWPIGAPGENNPYRYNILKFGKNVTIRMVRGQYTGGPITPTVEEKASTGDVAQSIQVADSTEVGMKLDVIPTMLMHIFGFTNVKGFPEESVKSTPDK